MKQRNVREFVEKYLQYGYSPAIISHLLEERFCEKVSHETLYIYIYSSPKELKKYLLRRKQGRKSKKNNRFTYVGTGKNIPNRIDISLRDKLANERKEFGHFEADSVVSCVEKRKTKSCLTVLVDRATRMTIIWKTASKTALPTTTSIIEALKPLSNNVISITYDNGCEFSQHEKITNASSTEKIDRFLKRLLFMYRDDIAKELGLENPHEIIECQVLDLSKVDWDSKTFGNYIGEIFNNTFSNTYYHSNY